MVGKTNLAVAGKKALEMALVVMSRKQIWRRNWPANGKRWREQWQDWSPKGVDTDFIVGTVNLCPVDVSRARFILTPIFM